MKKVNGIIHIHIYLDNESNHWVAISKDIPGMLVTGETKGILEDKISSILPMLIKENVKLGIFPGTINKTTIAYHVDNNGTVKCSSPVYPFA